MALDATVGGATANSYVDVATADAYFLTRPFLTTEWSGLSNGDKEKYLMFATQLLERQRWQGVRGATVQAGITQALAWPRQWAPTLEIDALPEVVSAYFVDLSTQYYSSLVIPTPIIRATCELVLEILKAGTVDPFARAGDPNRDVNRKRVDVLETEYFDRQFRSTGLGRFPAVWELIAPVLRAIGGAEIERV